MRSWVTKERRGAAKRGGEEKMTKSCKRSIKRIGEGRSNKKEQQKERWQKGREEQYIYIYMYIATTSSGKGGARVARGAAKRSGQDPARVAMAKVGEETAKRCGKRCNEEKKRQGAAWSEELRGQARGEDDEKQPER
jgi:hypothetical protein